MARNAIIRQHTEISAPPPRPPAPLLRPPAPPSPAEEVHYPDSDGSFLLQNFTHSEQLVYASEALRRHFHSARVALAVDAALYWEQGNNRAVLAPDLMVTLNHELQGDKTYQSWIEGRLPDFVLEVVSPSSTDNDKKLKKSAYERLGIPEYFLYDPDADQPAERLLGYRLDKRSGQYGAPLQPGSDGAVETPALGVSLRAEGSRLIIRNTATGEDYRPSPELQRRFGEVRLQREQAEARADQAEGERDAQKARAEQAEARAAREALQREQTEAENRRLKELLRALERRLSSNSHPPPSQEP